MNTTTISPAELIAAINQISEVTQTEVVVTSKDAAEILSQFYMDNGGNGSFTGPFIEKGNYKEQFWYITK